MKCNKCKIDKLSTEFYGDATCAIKLKRATCKRCNKEWQKKYMKRNKERQKERCKLWNDNNPGRNEQTRLKRKYGITVHDRDRMLAEQNHECYTCGYKEPIGARGKDRLHIDHDHATGVVRRMLCSSCNKALGIVKENTTILGNLIRYIEFFQNNSIMKN